MENLAGKLILVTGATGRQGGAAARHLLAQGFTVRALTRHPDHAEAHLLARKGATIVTGDLDDPASLPRVLEGAYGVFAVQDVLEHGFEGEVREGRNLVDAAARSGVRHLVYSSIAGAGSDPDLPLAPSKRAVEELVKSSGVPYTILRPASFMENFDLSREQILEGHLRAALPPDRKLQMIAVDDIGAFATLAFMDPEAWVGRELELAGAELTMPQAAGIFSEALEHEVVYEEVGLDDLARTAPAQVPMYTWLAERGFQVDVPALRARFPWLKTLGEWVRQAKWLESDVQGEAVHRPIGHSESPTLP
ncbi:MAG TPA: NmrA/HSCARG family protein [Fibrobacteria bacterium]|nr:NmrA/HSCARG family protein [Fibrobacteria bacterium]